MTKIPLNNLFTKLFEGVEIKTEEDIQDHVDKLRKMSEEEFNKKLKN